MADLLARLPAESAHSAFVRRIQASFLAYPAASSSKSLELRREQLTVRQCEVLDLLAERLRDKEIAERLSISRETVKTHLR